MTAVSDSKDHSSIQKATLELERSLACLKLAVDLENARHIIDHGPLPYLAFRHLNAAKHIARIWSIEADDQIGVIEKLIYTRTALLQLEYSWTYTHIPDAHNRAASAERLANIYAQMAGVDLADLKKKAQISAIVNGSSPGNPLQI